MIRSRILRGPLPGLLLLVACVSGDAQPPVVPAPVEIATVDPAPAVTTTSPTSSYVYEPVGRRDPFRPVTTTLRPEDRLPDAEELVVLGIISGTSNPVALLRDGEGNDYVVKRGTKVARYQGRVGRISARCVDIVQVSGAARARVTRCLSAI